VVDTYEDDAAVWLSYANYHESNEADAAQREALERAAELASDNPIVWLMMGRFEEQQDDMAAAGDAYARLLELRPGDPVASNNRAYCLLVTDGSAEEALELANEATEFLPNNPHLLHTLGVAQMRVGDLDAAGENLGKALVQRPGDPTMLLDVGQLLIKRGERDRGLRHVQEALTLSEFLGVDFPRSAEARQIIEGSEGPGATA
jgi:Flp pilus assembly protein TadD